MSTGYNALKLLIENWMSLRESRPEEKDFTQFGFEGLEAPSFDDLFKQWEETLKRGTSKIKFSVDPEDVIMGARLTKLFLDAKGAIDQTKANNSGFHGLLTTTGFFQSISEAGLLLATINENRVTLRRELIRTAESRTNKDITSIEDAAPVAKKILTQYEKIQDDAEKTEKSKETANEAIGVIEALTGKAAAGQKSISDLETAAKTSKGELDQLTTNLKTTNEKSREVLNSLEDTKKRFTDDIDSLKNKSAEEIGESNKKLVETREQLSKALEKVNRQGLAGAFADQGARIGFERVLWLGAFAISILGLIVVASLTAGYGPIYHWLLATGDSPIEPTSVTNVSASTTKALMGAVKTNGEDINWQSLLHGIPFAAPFIWFGWFSARQIGMLSKIQQDYIYKASTAIAFEGYKREAEAIKNEDLQKELLQVAIRNFGENPIRLYDGNDNHGLPIEEFISNLLDEKKLNKWLPQVTKICDAIGKCFPGKQ